MSRDMRHSGKKKSQGRPLWIGIGLILCGGLIYLLTSQGKFELVVDGTSSQVVSRRITVGSILKQAGVEFHEMDQVFPARNYWMTEQYHLMVNHMAEITLNQADGESVTFQSCQHLAGNILKDAGVLLYPGDQVWWDDTPIRPDLLLPGSESKTLTLRHAERFFLIRDDWPEAQESFGSGATVGDVLRSAGVTVSRSHLVFPSEDTPFVPEMTIQVAALKSLTVSANGRLTQIVSGGATVGEALARGGLPLQGSAVSIPAAGEALPEDGRILIVPVRDEFEMSATAERSGTEWQANDTLELDRTNVLSEGQDGLKGTRTRIRYENNEEVLHTTTEEQVLVEAIPEKCEYGTKVTVRTLDTPDGTIEYWRAVPAYATSYSPCRSGVSGCLNNTASGAPVQRGVIGVTSAWYQKMKGQRVYIPDYGQAVIGDVGGGISGKNWIDLAYSDDDFVSWSKDTTLYFLTPIPSDIPWVLP